MRLRFTIDVDLDAGTQAELNRELGKLLPALNTALDDIGYGWSTGGSTANVEILEPAEVPAGWEGTDG